MSFPNFHFPKLPPISPPHPIRKLSRPKKPVRIALFLTLILSMGVALGYVTNHAFSEDAKFERYTEEIFRKEVSSNTLNLHYSLADPEKQGIPRQTASLGTVDTNMEEVYALCESYENDLQDFDYEELSRENRLTLDMLLLYFHTQRSLGDGYLLEEMLGPSLGIQAQLPVLLAEYAFYTEEDISDYLNLLGSVPEYFDSILSFQKEKSAAGYFMSDATLDRVLAQCQSFIENPDENYMLDIFRDKLSDYGGFSEEDLDRLCAAHKKILTEQVIPAYQKLMTGLDALRGTGKSSRGLAHFPGGKQYYRYLLESSVGSYMTVARMEERLLAQLKADTKEIRLMLKEQPSLADKVGGGADLPSMEPADMMETLRQNITEDFPALSDADYEIRYVHESMEDFLSPAFYLTPPLDTGTPNVIYINQAGRTSNLELFTTLAHEGFPGHLYQTVSFGRTAPANIRYLINSNGYVEGWATYIESYAYGYAASLLDDVAAADVTRMAWLNRSVNLCLYSLLDIGIHYHGWTLTDTTKFLRVFGITDAAVISEIFQYIVETPANYLKYYWGYLNFLDLKSAEEKRLGDKFSLSGFHKSILEIGPVQFPVLAKYIKQYNTGG